MKIAAVTATPLRIPLTQFFYNTESSWSRMQLNDFKSWNGCARLDMVDTATNSGIALADSKNVSYIPTFLDKSTGEMAIGYMNASEFENYQKIHGGEC